jgi:hypothetical protein
MHHSSHVFRFKLLQFVVLLLFAFGTLSVSAAPARTSRSPEKIDERLIRSAIDRYLTAKADALRTRSVPSFALLTAADGEGTRVASREKTRIEFQIEQQKQRGFSYESYAITIDINAIDVDAFSGTAVVDAIETDRARTNVSPDVESISATPHSITMKKVGATWRVANDVYTDELNRVLFDSGRSFEQILSDLRQETSEVQSERSAILSAAGVSDESTNAQINALRSAGYSNDEINAAVIAPLQQRLHEAALMVERPGTDARAMSVIALGRTLRPLNAANAVAYAHRWAMGRNPAFFDFAYNKGLGGDCTNFVSQCINAGGAPMVRTGSLTWFYDAINPPPGSYGAKRSSSWSGVPYLYNFLMSNAPAGPVGRTTSSSTLLPSDVVQLYDPSLGWHHSAVVVSAQWKYVWSWSAFRNVWVFDVQIACHEDNKDYYSIDGWAGITKRFVTVSY